MLVDNTYDKKISNFDTIFFLVTYIPWVFAWMISSSNLKDYLHPYAIINLYSAFGFVLVIISFFSKKKIEASFFTRAIPCLIIGAIVSYGNDNASFVLIVLVFLYLARNVDLDLIVRITMVLQIVSMILTIGSAIIGIIPNDLLAQYYDGEIRLRHTLGYTYTTYAPNYLFTIVIEAIYLSKKQKRFNWILLLLSGCFNILIYKYTDTRMGFYMVWLALMGYCVLYLTNKSQNYTKLRKYITINIYPVATVLSFLFALKYNPNNALMYRLNTIMSQRIRYTHEGLEQWGVTLFGTSVKWNIDATTYNYVDNSYVNIGICYGVIILLFIVLGLMNAMRKSYKERDRYLTFVLALWAIKAIIDPQLFLLWFNPFLIVVGKEWFRVLKKEPEIVVDNLCV